MISFSVSSTPRKSLFFLRRTDDELSCIGELSFFGITEEVSFLLDLICCFLFVFIVFQSR